MQLISWDAQLYIEGWFNFYNPLLFILLWLQLTYKYSDI